MIFLERQIKN